MLSGSTTRLSLGVLLLTACGHRTVASERPAAVAPAARNTPLRVEGEASASEAPIPGSAAASPHERVRRLLIGHPEVRWVLADGYGESWSWAIAWDGTPDGICLSHGEATPLCFASPAPATSASLGEAWTEGAGSGDREHLEVLELSDRVIEPVGRRFSTESRDSEVPPQSWRPVSGVLDPPSFIEPLAGVMVQTRASGLLQVGDPEAYQRGFECARIDGRWGCSDQTPEGPMGTAEALSVSALGDDLLVVEYISRNMESGMDSWHRTETYAVVFRRSDGALVPVANLTLGIHELRSVNVGAIDPERALTEFAFGFDLAALGPCLRLTPRPAGPRRPRGARRYSFRAPVFVDVPDEIDLDGRADLDRRGLLEGLLGGSGRRRPTAPRLSGLWRFDPDRGFVRSDAGRCSGVSQTPSP